MDLTFVVTYYDPYWHLLWGESGGGGFYLPTAGKALPMGAGERVRLRGTVVPAVGLDGSTLEVRVFSKKALPEPVATAGNIEKSADFNARWVSVEGYVCRESWVDPGHMQLDVLTDSRLVTTRVILGLRAAAPPWTNKRVRIQGVYVASRDAGGNLEGISLWVPRPDEIAVLGSFENDPRFSLPRTPIAQLPTVHHGKWTRIAGEVWSRDAERSLTVRDDSGQIAIATEQPGPVQVGDTVEVVGKPHGEGIRVALRNPIFRVVPRGSVPGAAPALGRAPAVLSLAEQVTDLRRREAEEHRPVSLHGVVTWSRPEADFFFVQDSTGGVEVKPESARRLPLVGRMVSVEGVSEGGAFTPWVQARRIAEFGASLLPVPDRISLDQAMTGTYVNRWVAMEGYVREVRPEGKWLRLELTASTGGFSALMAPDSANPGRMPGSRVRVTGVCEAVTDDSQALVGIRLWVPTPDAVQIEEEAPADPFAAPARTIGDLRQAMTAQAIDDRVRVRGVVLTGVPGRYFYLQESDAGILVLSRDPRPLPVGKWVEAVGLPGRVGNRFALREAAWRPATAGRPPVVLDLANPARLDPRADGRLVRVRGRLNTVIFDGPARRLVLHSGRSIFEARLIGGAEAAVPVSGSIVEVTGVYRLQFDEYRLPHAFLVQLRGPADIRVVEAPAWLSARKADQILAALAACALVGVAWVTVLRRRLARQARQIREQHDEEIRLRGELERAARLESLGLIAGGIAHDFNNLLTVVIANLELAGMEGVSEGARKVLADAGRGAMRASDLTKQLLTFAKGGDPVRSAVALADVVKESADFAAHGSKVRCEYAFAPGLFPANVDRGQIERVVHNLILNAMQAMPEGGVIQVLLRNAVVAAGEMPRLGPGRYLKLTIADNGKGMAPEQLEKIFEPYFTTKGSHHGLGLATVHSIVRKHQGRITAESEVGKGTAFHIWLPAADAPAEAVKEPQPAPAAAPARESRALRLLFMDDDEPIRRAAESLFRRLGHEARIVAEGSEAVREFAAARSAGKPYDAVVLDLTVPGGMGGRQAMEELMRIDPGVRAIVASGYSSDPILANHRAYGFRARVSKPYDVKTLAQAIREALEDQGSRTAAGVPS